MRVALINTFDHGGGAETVVRLLLDGLRSRGHETSLRVGRCRGDGNDEHTRQIPNCADDTRVANRYARRGLFGLGIPSSAKFCESDSLADVDLIHLHNVHGHYFSLTDVRLLAKRCPLVWTFHDFFPITGGCAFPTGCDRWMSQCGECPQLGQYPIVTQHDRTRRMLSIKRQVFGDLPVHVITPSRHLGESSQRSQMFKQASFHEIPYGVDTDLFHPHRSEARRTVGVEDDRPVVFLSAQGLDDPRKGLDYAVAALARIKCPRLVVLVAGGGDCQPLVEALHMHDVRPLGYMTNATKLASCYAAADLFLFTSLAENFPCSVQEAMSSATAVLSFDIDGVTEQIDQDRTGYLVSTGDTDSLSRVAQRLLLNRDLLSATGLAARGHAVAKWNLDLFLSRHEALYRRILQHQAPPQSNAVFCEPISHE